MGRFLRFLFVSFFLITVGVAGAGYVLFKVMPASTEVLRTAGEKKIIFIPKGSRFRSVVELMTTEGWLRYPKLFFHVGRLSGLSKGIPAGEFEISTRLPMWDLYTALRSTPPVSYKLVIPEGSNIHDIARLLAFQNLAPSEEFLSFVAQPATLAKYSLSQTGAPSLEGYLFPDTYQFTKLHTVPEIVDVFVKAFRRRFLSEWEERARFIGMTPHEVIILASVVEKETGAPGERPLISAVFHNRLKQAMKLQSDPTTIYGIKNFDGNLTRKHLNTYSPYNTYRIRGLPLGPIANPGVDAIKAALYPAEAKYLYFVAKNDGSHHFSVSYAEHNRAVIYYQKMKRTGALPKKL